LLGVTGSVGVISIPYYIKMLKDEIAKNIVVIMSHSARKFITPYTLRLFSGNYVHTDVFDVTNDSLVPHIHLARKSDLFLIMPATANIIGKLANGIADDLISSTAIASPVPVGVVPSMNSAMWNSKAMQKNLLSLENMGYYVLQPDEGICVADMEPTMGCMPEFSVVADFIRNIILSRHETLR
jgi:phosphopantothenoylcysteine decarboxylase